MVAYLRIVALEGPVIFYLLVVSVKLVFATKDYCSLNDHHTMCMYKTTSSLCVKYGAVRSQETIEKIVKDHNKARSKYASGHSGFFVPNMLKLYWDQELADISARWACQCKSNKDRYRDVSEFELLMYNNTVDERSRFKVAQIVWSQQDSLAHRNWSELWSQILNSSFSGFFERDYWGNMISNPVHSSSPLYIIYNPRVKYLGCTLAKYQVWVDSDGQFVYKTTLVCNYGPYEETPMNLPGEDWPCRDCPVDHPCFTEYYVMRNSIPENLPDERNLCIDPKLENSKPHPGKACHPARHRDETFFQRNGVMNGSDVTTQQSGGNETQHEHHDVDETLRSKSLGDWGKFDQERQDDHSGGPINYCSIVCRSGHQHTMCKYKEDQFEDEDLDGKEPDNATVTTETNANITEISGNETDSDDDIEKKVFETPGVEHIKNSKKNTNKIKKNGTRSGPSKSKKNEIGNITRHSIAKRDFVQRLEKEMRKYSTVEPAKRTKIPPSVVTRPPTTVKPVFVNGRRCRNFLSMTNSLVIDDLLRLHNEYRNEFSEGNVGFPHYLPGNMLIMQWNYTLQDIAERWIRQCHLYHDTCRDSVFIDPWSGDMRLFEVGQNIGWRRFNDSDEMPSHRDIFNDWLNQSVKFPGRSIERILEYKQAPLCDYTQIVWASTYMVGCAFAVFDDTTSSVAFLVCNYAPIGCSRGKPIYIPGGPCTLCDSETAFEFSRCTRNFPNLCSLEWDPNEGINVTNYSPTDRPPPGFYSTITMQIVINYLVAVN